ncbi:hypothetical protein HEB94_004648 [Actinopolymorpha pittospori]|uniref:Uncharacterized protein n=1 Tax=Actinopolymorpha pittospori TaxID=648752 RepID=A0A927RD60_9ACTN|nr:hypothetical protein [Actinopolymorpha pittospori]
MATSLLTSTAEPSPGGAPVFVPGYGWVDWSKELLDAQARYLLLLHQPDQSWTKLRLVGSRRVDPPRCLYCGQEWTCAEFAWASAWLSPLGRLWGRHMRDRGGRHRAPGPARVGGAARVGGGAGRRSA